MQPGLAENNDGTVDPKRYDGHVGLRTTHPEIDGAAPATAHPADGLGALAIARLPLRSLHKKITTIAEIKTHSTRGPLLLVSGLPRPAGLPLHGRHHARRDGVPLRLEQQTNPTSGYRLGSSIRYMVRGNVVQENQAPALVTWMKATSEASPVATRTK